MPVLRFEHDDLLQFIEVSGDRSPVHASALYARKTPFGEPILFGIQLGLAAMGQLRDRPGFTLTGIDFEYLGPGVTDRPYTLTVSDANDRRARVQIAEGLRPLLDGEFSFAPAAMPHAPLLAGAVARNENSPLLGVGDIKAGLTFGGRYGVTPDGIDTLLRRYGIRQTWAAPAHIAVMLWASYLVGMNCPGRDSLSSRCRIRFVTERAPICPFDFAVEVSSVSPVGEIAMTASLLADGIPFATVQQNAFLRDTPTAIDIESIRNLKSPGQSLVGKTALVVGGSRGLGAALVAALAQQGCSVLANYHLCADDAEALRAALGGDGANIKLRPGDCTRSDFWERSQQWIPEKLDFLFCNAFIPNGTRWLNAATSAEAIGEFVTRSLLTVATPIQALSTKVAKAEGWIVLSSCAATPAKATAHIATAKTAAEELLRDALARHPDMKGLILRPKKLLSDANNTSTGRRGAFAPELVAMAVVQRLITRPAPSRIEVMEDFEARKVSPGTGRIDIASSSG